MKKKLVIFGNSELAAISYEYFEFDSEYTVVAFTLEESFMNNKTDYLGKPLVPFSQIKSLYPPSEYYMFIPISSVKLNRIRTKYYNLAKDYGYKFVSYVSSHAFVWKNVKIGENTFIFENNTIQPFSEIGNNTILWSGNHIGHHSIIGNNVFIASHAVISGHVSIKDNCFVGVNSTFVGEVVINEDCFIGAGALVKKDIPANSIVKGDKIIENKARSYCKVKDNV